MLSKLQCPRCKNEEILEHHNFCKICGLRLPKESVNSSVTLIIPVDDIKLRTEPMKSTVRSRKQKWTSYKRVSLKEVRKCLSTYSASL